MIAAVVRLDSLCEVARALGRGLHQLEIEAPIGAGSQLDLVVDRLVALLFDDELVLDRLQPAAIELPVLVALDRGFPASAEILDPERHALERLPGVVLDRPLHDGQFHLAGSHRAATDTAPMAASTNTARRTEHTSTHPNHASVPSETNADAELHLTRELRRGRNHEHR